MEAGESSQGTTADILAKSVSKTNPFAGISTSNQLWCAFFLISFSVLYLCPDTVFYFTVTQLLYCAAAMGITP